ncbi:hypothetical protein BGZ72_000581 [Mortierella alpina]|nr:hypothetical protein BGZ72_000581 [Mortierella alpina]
MDTKRKVDESIALLNSLFAHPAKRHSSNAEKQPSFSNASPVSPSPAIPSPLSDKALLIAARRQSYKPPRPAVLDRLSRLAASRPTLHDSIAASIAASAPTTQLVAAASIEPTGAGTQSSDATLAHQKAEARKRYMPWSRDQFHERLETFKPSTWFDKPKMVNAVECAKRGWINTSDDRLECCGGCGGVVIVRIDLESDALRKQDSTDIEGNSEDPNAAGKSDSALDIDDFIPEQDIEEQMEALERSFQNGPSTKPLILSLFGWTTVKNQKVLSCQACHTQCTFISNMGVQSTITHGDSTEDDGMGQEDEDDTAFDVVQSHKWYCYWINSSYDQDHKEGWRILYETLTAANRPSDAVAQIKRMLRGQTMLPPS